MIPELSSQPIIDHMQAACDMLLEAGAPASESMTLFRKALAQAAMKRTNNNRSRAAKLTGTHRNTFMRWVGPKFRRQGVIRVRPNKYPARRVGKSPGREQMPEVRVRHLSQAG